MNINFTIQIYVSELVCHSEQEAIDRIKKALEKEFCNSTVESIKINTIEILQ